MTPSWSSNPVADLSVLWSYPYARHALVAGTIVAIVASAMGWLMVQRRQAFLGHTLSLVAYPGAALATALALPVALGYYGAVVAAALVAAATRGRGPGDLRRNAATTGVLQATALAAGLLVSSLSPSFVESTTSLLFGSFLGVTSSAVVVLAAVSAATLLVLACCARPLLLATFDPLAAEAAGLPVQFLAVLETVLLGTVVASVSQLTGSLLVFALLVMPASAALQLTTAIWPSIAISIGIGIATTWVGLGVAFFVPHLPLGFTITTTGFATYLVASAWRGLAERPRRTVATA